MITLFFSMLLSTIIYLAPILAIILIVIYIINLKERKNNIINNNNDKTNTSSKYITKNYIMTPTELKFYKQLKKITDKLNTTIFSQVNLERIIQVNDNNKPDRNRIKSRSIDYTIVRNTDCKIICCIELDDKYHNSEKIKKLDEFKNQIFKEVNIPLYRIKVNNYYNLENLKELIEKEIKKEEVKI